MDSVNPDPSNIPNDDLTLQNYQDDVDTSDDITDPVMNEAGEDITKELGVDPDEFGDELKHYDFDDVGRGDDDRREELEDYDQDDDEDPDA